MQTDWGIEIEEFICKHFAILVTAMTMISLTSGPASAIEKPKDSDGTYIEAGVDVKDPRVSSDLSGKEKFFNPCNNLMVAVTYPKMKFKSLSGLAVPIYWN